MDSKWDELKGNYGETHYNQIFKSKKQRENIETSKIEANHHMQVILNKIISRFLLRNFGDQKTVGWNIKSATRKKTVNQESYIRQDCPSEVRKKLRHSWIKEKFYKVKELWGWMVVTVMIIWMYLIPLNCTLKVVKMVNVKYVYFTTIK